MPGCGASSEQKEMWSNQSQFFQTLTSNYGKVFGKQQGILDKLTSTLTPIFAKGPNQQGFSDAQRSTLNTQALESTARGYGHAKEALGNERAARGGDAMVPSGADTNLDARLAATAAGERADLGQKITMADYDQGYRNWQYAGQGLGQVAEMENPSGVAGMANQAGNYASQTADQIAQADNSIWGVVGGALGGVAGQAAGGYLGGMKH